VDCTFFVCFLMCLFADMFAVFGVHGGHFDCEAEGGRSSSAGELLCAACGTEGKFMCKRHTTC
jgi:hypothetical protein